MGSRQVWLQVAVAWFLAKAKPALASRIAGLGEAGLSYLEYDWSLNDSARNK